MYCQIKLLICGIINNIIELLNWIYKYISIDNEEFYLAQVSFRNKLSIEIKTS